MEINKLFDQVFSQLIEERKNAGETRRESSDTSLIFEVAREVARETLSRRIEIGVAR